MKFIFALIVSLFLILPLQAKPVELVLWHAMSGNLSETLNELATAFNHHQNEFHLKLVYKGDYIETLTSFAAAFRAGQPPDLVQIFEVGTASMLAPEGIIKPVEQLMQEQKQSLPLDDFIPAVRHFYSKNGQLMAMPFNLSIPILYYNAEILEPLGYDSAHFPESWQALERLAEQLKKAGYRCAYTSTYPAWILLESYLALHGQGERGNLAENLLYLNKQFARLKYWQEQGYFRYAGRTDNATMLFTSGVCPLFSQSSGSYNSLVEGVPFRLGIALLPIDSEFKQSRHANISGGAALWVVAGRSPEKEKAIANFFSFLAQPDIQKQWYEHSGYLPLGLTGQYASIVKETRHPVLALASIDLAGSIGRPAQQINPIPQYQIRTVYDEVLEVLFAGLKTLNLAMHDATQKMNHLVLRYRCNTEHYCSSRVMG